MSRAEHTLERRQLLRTTGAGLVGAAVLSTGVGATQTRDTDTAPDEEEYEEILAGMDGDGSEGNRYSITDVVELQAISGDLTANYELAADIDASPTADWNDGSGFDPIGPPPSDGDGESDDTSADTFRGTIRGNGREISGLTVDRPDEEGAGLLLINDGTLVNFTLTDATVTGQLAGGLVGSNNGGLAQITVEGEVQGQEDTGGLVGTNTSQLVNCEAEVTVTAEETTGGLVGANTGTIIQSTARGDVSGSDNVGGLIGQSSGDIRESGATGSVSGSNRVGGCVGELTGGAVGTEATGDVTGESAVGGFAGEAWGELLGLAAEGAVDGEEHVGGLVGKNYGTVSVCLARGQVTGTTNVGGLVGWGTAGSQISDVYSVSPVRGDSTVGALVGLLGWEFMDEGGTVDLQNAYWSSDAGVPDPVGRIESGDGEVTADEGSIEGLTRTLFDGESAPTHLSAFDFEQEWRAVPSDIPAPRALTRPIFEVTNVAETEIVVEPGGTFRIEAEIENTSEWDGTQRVLLLLDNRQVAGSEQTLAAGESTQITFGEIATDDVAEGVYTFTVRTRNDLAEGTVEIGTGATDDGTPGGSEDDDSTDQSDDDGTPGDDGDDGTAADADDDGPGFGVGAAITGIGTGVYLLARRLDPLRSDE